jgi:hypothetical protein
MLVGRQLVVRAALILGLNLRGVGIVDVHPCLLFPFGSMTSPPSVLLFVVISVRLTSLPTAGGSVMALQSAACAVSGALGLPGFDLVLLVLADVPAAYRVIGVVVLAVLAPIALYACRPASLPEASTVGADRGNPVSCTQPSSSRHEEYLADDRQLA